nr:zinc finger, CCHC-type [Tanacetum cinerariifolium]
MQEPGEQHIKAIRQVLRYVKGTKDYGITYKHNGENKIHGYNDSSYGVNTQEGKGTTGIIFYYGESPMSWSRQKQAIVALLSYNRKDKTAIAILYLALPEDQVLQITKHKTAKAIWDSLKTRHIGEERVQQARLQTLKSDFEMLHIKEDETIDTFTTKLTTLVNKEASLGHTMEDETLVHKLLNDVPDGYLQIVVSIEQYSDLSVMTLEEAIGRLKTYEERIKYKKGKQVDNQEKLMFTQHENKEKYFRARGRGKHKFSQGRNHANFKEERKDEETSHRS